MTCFSDVDIFNIAFFNAFHFRKFLVEHAYMLATLSFMRCPKTFVPWKIWMILIEIYTLLFFEDGYHRVINSEKEALQVAAIIIHDWERICRYSVLHSRAFCSITAQAAGLDGRVAEWLKAPVLKTGVRVTVPWVRIPPLPPNNIPIHSKSFPEALIFCRFLSSVFPMCSYAFPMKPTPFVGNLWA